MIITYFGNMSNKGVNFAEHAIAAGHEVKLIFAPFQVKRCRLEDFYGEHRDVPLWAKTFGTNDLREMIDELCRSVRTSDVVIATGAFEAAHLILNKIPFYWFVSGGEISEQPFRDNEESIRYRRILTSGKSFIKGIISNHNDVRFAARLLELSEKIIPICDVPFILPEFRIGGAIISKKPTIASYTRRVYSGGFTHSKGTEHIVDFLRVFKNEGRDRDFSIRLTLDGPDAVRFKHEVDDIGLADCIYLGSISRYQLARDLRDYHPIVLDQFGERESVLSGIIRESIAMGCPVLCDNFFYDRFALNLKSPVPVLFACDASSIREKVHLLSSTEFYKDFQIKMLEYSRSCFDSKIFIEFLLGSALKS